MSQQQRPRRVLNSVRTRYYLGDIVFHGLKPLNVEAAKEIIRQLVPQVEAAVRRRPSVARFAQSYAAATLQVSPAALTREHNLLEFSFPNNDSNPTNRV